MLSILRRPTAPLSRPRSFSCSTSMSSQSVRPTKTALRGISTIDDSGGLLLVVSRMARALCRASIPTVVRHHQEVLLAHGRPGVCGNPRSPLIGHWASPSAASSQRSAPRRRRALATRRYSCSSGERRTARGLRIHGRQPPRGLDGTRGQPGHAEQPPRCAPCHATRRPPAAQPSARSRRGVAHSPRGVPRRSAEPTCGQWSWPCPHQRRLVHSVRRN